MKSRLDIFKCDSYEKNQIRNIFEKYFKDLDVAGKKVLLKPNMLQAHKPEDNVTTHPKIVEALAELLLAKGARCFIGDSPSGFGIENAKAAALECGFLNICDNLAIEFEYFDAQELEEVKVEKGKIFQSVYLPKNLRTFDMIFNLPKLKTHNLTIFTLGAKNMLGIIPGLSKTEFHRRAMHPRELAKALCDLFSVCIPTYTILDGIESMEGQGPVGGTTRLTKRIFISNDTNALDAEVARLCGISPNKVPLTREIESRGIGSINEVDIIRHYEGDDKEFRGFKVSPFSKISNSVPKWFLGLLSLLVDNNPEVVISDCVLCGFCKEICPVDAIDLSSGKVVFDRKKCIKCYCCSERCPEKAIHEKNTWFLRKFLKNRHRVNKAK